VPCAWRDGNVRLEADAIVTSESHEWRPDRPDSPSWRVNPGALVILGTTCLFMPPRRRSFLGTRR